MNREEAKQAIAKYCGTTIAKSDDNFCSFVGLLFSVNLLSRPRKVGFHYYSDADLGDESSVMGPWMQNILQSNGFSKNECKVRTNRSPNSEGHVADFYLDIDWENLSHGNLESIKNLYDRLKVFQENVWPTDETERMQAIREYNKNHLDEVRRYIQNRKHEQLEVNDENQDDETSQIGTNEDNFMINKIKNLLKSNLQVILTGAPGTGKTYTARKVAEAIVTEGISPDDVDARKKAMDERFQSVQFHPGYDYSDFVIGMKPVLLNEAGNEVMPEESGKGKLQVSFRWKKGIFMDFAQKAKEAYDNAKNKATAPKFVFLIDEINRADLSRVFGELFSLLEEEYRYPKNQTGITLPNGAPFHIPANLYIIGTMNDIDRSVESMDFALRRRFAWYEVKAEQSQDIISKKVSDKNAAKSLAIAMQNLNAVIGGEKMKLTNGTETDLRLGTAYQLGGAIFAKFEKCGGNFDTLWNNHISNVLGEYLRGRRDREDILKELKGIFDKAVGGVAGGQPPEQNAGDISAPSDQPATPQP